MVRKIIKACLLISLLIPISASAGTTGKIVGSVEDAGTGEPLIGVNVLVDGTFLGATTDLEGNYLILNVPPGVYTLVFQYIGYQEKRVEGVRVSVDFTTRQNAQLREDAMELDESIVVVADRDMIRKDLTSSQSEVTADDIANIPVEEFEDVLQLQAGITRDAGGGFHIRGGRSSEVAFWVDGVSVTDAFDGSNGVEIENDAVQSLQVISGTFNAEYGQAMSGIINIVTKDGGQKYSGSVSAYTGDYISGDDGLFTNIDEVSPSHLYDWKINLGGPVPFTDGRLTFFTNFRNSYDDGYLYGQRIFNTDGTPGDSSFVPMNWNRWYTSQNKLTYQINPSMKLRFGFNYEDREWQDYNHFYKFNPDAEFQKFQTGYNGSLTFDHTINVTTFYTLKLASFKKEFEQYVYESPSDPRYVDNASEEFAVSAFQFSKGGQQTNYFNRSTLNDIVKFDITSQISDKHLIKTGFEARRYELNLEDFNIIDSNVSDTLYTPIRPPVEDINFGQYTFEPIEFAFYIQDKVEYDDFILNVGLRFDYFDSKGNVLADPQDPSRFSPLREEYQDDMPSSLEDIWYEKADPKFSVSPRIGMAFPISARGVIHASYGHFSQIPEFQLLYANPGFKVTRGQGNLVGNADLKPQRTVMYEIGLQQQMTDDIGMDITGFYRDVRNWVSTSPLIETYRPDILYSQYENRDYANVRGITFSLNKRFSNYYSANVSYTMQVAEGNASNPTDAFNDIQSNREPRKSIIPLDWDRRHVLNGNIYVGVGTWGLSLLGRFESGLPYTPTPVQGTQRGASTSAGSIGLQQNSERRPNLVTLDMQLFKDIPLDFFDKETKLQLFLKIYNLLDARNEQVVWGDTGRATYTLQSAVSGADADPRFIIRPDFYTEPRRVQFGVSFDF